MSESSRLSDWHIGWHCKLRCLVCKCHTSRLPRLYSSHLKCTMLKSGSVFELKSLLSVAKEASPNPVSLKLKLETSGRFMGLQANGAVSLNILRQSSRDTL